MRNAKFIFAMIFFANANTKSAKKVEIFTIMWYNVIYNGNLSACPFAETVVFADFC